MRSEVDRSNIKQKLKLAREQKKKLVVRLKYVLRRLKEYHVNLAHKKDKLYFSLASRRDALKKHLRAVGNEIEEYKKYQRYS